MKEWKKDKRWSDQFLPEIKSILGMYLISEPAIEEDQERNTDLTVLTLTPFRIGCRVRKIFYLKDYSDEFTIRVSRPSGQKTELSKIVEGWGDYFFYGFGEEEILHKWTLCNLNVFRLWYNTQLYHGIHPGEFGKNKDGSSNFLAFKWIDIPDNFIIAQKGIDNARTI